MDNLFQAGLRMLYDRVMLNLKVVILLVVSYFACGVVGHSNHYAIEIELSNHFVGEMTTTVTVYG